MAELVHISKQGERLQLDAARTYYRCERCGTVEAPHQVLPSDDGPPEKDCGCYMGPRWVKGVWMPVKTAVDPNTVDRGET